MKKYVRTAEQPSVEDVLNDNLSTLKDDFNFLVDGIEKIAADGDFGKASELAATASEMINGAIEEMAENISAE